MVGSEQFHAHKIMLCAGSLYFKRHILESRLPQGSMDNGSMIFICIDKVNARQLTQLLDYIYKGEIQVSESVSTFVMSIKNRMHDLILKSPK